MRRQLVFPYIPPGSNAIKRMHYQEVARMRRQVRDDVARLHPAGGPIDPARLTLDFRWRTRVRRDVLNFAEGAKALVDALVGIWLVDDDTHHLPETYVTGQTGTGQPDHIIVTVEQAGSDR